MKMEQTECSETSAYKIQTPGNYPEKNIQHYTIPLKIVKMIITQTKLSKNIRIQQYSLIAKELEVERNMDDNTIHLIIIGNASENAAKCIRGSHRVPSLSWP